MRYSSQVKLISYLKANAAEVRAQLAEQREPTIITHSGVLLEIGGTSREETAAVSSGAAARVPVRRDRRRRIRPGAPAGPRTGR